MDFKEIYLKFNKATAFMQENQVKRVSHEPHFNELCKQLNNAWNSLNFSQKNAVSSELVSLGTNNIIFHYQLYGEAKESWGRSQEGESRTPVSQPAP